MTIIKNLSPRLTAHSNNSTVWKFALLSCALVWGGSFVVLKNSLDVMEPNWLMFWRFFFTFILVASLFFKQLKAHFNVRHLKKGVLLGVFLGCGYCIQNLGLLYTTPGKNAFLTAAYCMMVPFFAWVLQGKRPHFTNLMAAFLCLGGVGLVSLNTSDTLSLGPGELLTLFSAFFYAFHIALTGKLGGEKYNMIALTVIQMFVCMLVSLAFALIRQEVPPTLAVVTPDLILGFLYLVLLSSGYCMVVQNLGQARVPSSEAALLLSFESVFAVLCSALFYGEHITGTMFVGFCLIFSSVIVSEVDFTMFRKIPHAIRRRRARLRGTSSIHHKTKDSNSATRY